MHTEVEAGAHVWEALGCTGVEVGGSKKVAEDKRIESLEAEVGGKDPVEDIGLDNPVEERLERKPFPFFQPCFNVFDWPTDYVLTTE